MITVNETDLGSKAQIGSGAVINSSGNVAVISATEDRSMHNIAESKVNTQDQVNNGPIINAAVAVGSTPTPLKPPWARTPRSRPSTLAATPTSTSRST